MLVSSVVASTNLYFFHNFPPNHQSKQTNQKMNENRSTFAPVRRFTSSILDAASNKSNKNSPTTTSIIPSSLHSTNSNSMQNRNGGQINRGIEFLRNAFFHKNGGNGGGNNANSADSDSTEYRKLQSSTKNDAIITDEPIRMTVVGIEDNVGAIKRQNLSNGYVVGDKTDLD